MLNDRFGELARKPDAKFLGAGGGGGPLTPTVQTFSLQARVPDGSLLDGLNVLEIEARRVREHGFNQSELDRNKREMAAYYEQAYNERDKSESGGYARRVHPALPRGRARARHRVRIPARAERPARHHAPGSDDARTLAPVGPQPRGPGSAAGEAGPAAALGRRSPLGDHRGRQGGGHAVERYDHDARARRKDPGTRPRRIAPRARQRRRHRRAVRQRRGGVAETHRLQERPGPVHDVLAGRRVARRRGRTSWMRRWPRATWGIRCRAA